MATTYATWDVPTFAEEETSSQNLIEFKSDFLFNFETGDFELDGAKKVIIADGETAWKQWCIKQCQIERFALLAYDKNAGIETNLIQEQVSRKQQEAMIERTLTEALMSDARTSSVYGFAFQWDSDNVYVSMVIVSSQSTKLDVSIQLSI